MKIDLGQKKTAFVEHSLAWSVPWRRSKPFFLSDLGTLVHRVRFAATHMRLQARSHDSVEYWCGSSSSVRGRFLDEPPENRLLCHRCEAQAVAHGQPSAGGGEQA